MIARTVNVNFTKKRKKKKKINLFIFTSCQTCKRDVLQNILASLFHTMKVNRDEVCQASKLTDKPTESTIQHSSHISFAFAHIQIRCKTHHTRLDINDDLSWNRERLMSLIS